MNKINSICILGSTLSSYFTALYILNNLKNINIHFIEIENKEFDLDITTDNITPFIQNCGIDNLEFLKNTNSIFKIANSLSHNVINKKYKKYFVNDIEKKVNRKDLINAMYSYYMHSEDLNFELIDRLLYPILTLCDDNLFTPDFMKFSIFKNTSYQLQTKKVISYIKNKCLKFKEFIKYDKISNFLVEYDETKNIKHLKVNDKIILCDLYINGFDNKNQYFKRNKNDYVCLENIFNTNNLINTKIKYSNKYKQLLSYSKIKGIEFGWLHYVHTYDYYNINFLYNDTYSSEHFIKLLEDFDVIEQNNSTLNLGHYKNIWEKNLLNVGVASHSLDFFETNELFNLHEILNKLKIHQNYISEFNMQEINYKNNNLIEEKIYNFIKNYHQLYHRNDNSFWNFFNTKKFFDDFKKYYMKYHTDDKIISQDEINKNISNIFYMANNHNKQIKNYNLKYINYYQWLKNNIFEKE